MTGIHWIAVGGETGNRFRPFDVRWARNLRSIAERDKIAFFYEGANGRSDNHRFGGNLLDGRVYQQYPNFERYTEGNGRLIKNKSFKEG